MPVETRIVVAVILQLFVVVEPCPAPGAAMFAVWAFQSEQTDRARGVFLAVCKSPFVSYQRFERLKPSAASVALILLLLAGLVPCLNLRVLSRSGRGG